MANNRDLPTYEPQVKLEVTPVPDVQSSADHLINAFSNFASTANSIESRIGKSMLEDQRAEMRNQIANTYSDFSMQVINHPDKQVALANYNQQSRAYAEEYLENTHFWNKNYARNMLDYFADTHRKPILSAVQQQLHRVNAVNSAIEQNDLTTQVLNAIENSTPMIDENGVNHQFDAARTLMADQFRSLTRDYIAGNTRLDVVRNTIPNLTKKYNRAMASKGYIDELVQGRGEQYIKDFYNTKIEGMDEAEKTYIINTVFKKKQEEYLTAQGISLSALNRDKNTVLKSIEDGGTVNTQFLHDFKIAQPKEAYNDFQKQIVISQAVHDAKTRFSTANPAQIEQEVETYRPQNPDDPNYKYQDLLYKKVKAAAAQTMQALYQDPMALSLQEPSIKKMMSEWEIAKQAGATGTNFPNSPLNTQIPHPDYAIAYYQERRGLMLGGPTVNSKNLAVRFFTDAQAKSLVSTIHSADARQKIAIFQKLKDESGSPSFFNARIQQLVKSGMNPQLATAANIDPTSPYAYQIMEALSMPMGGENGLDRRMTASHKDVKNDLDDAIQGDVDNNTTGLFRSSSRNNFSGYMSSLGAYSGVSASGVKDQMVSSLKNLSYYAVMSGIAKDHKSALNWAEGVLSERYTITNMNGQSIRVPNQYNADTVAAYARDKQSLVAHYPFKLSGPTVDLRSGVRASEVDKEDIMNGHWANDPMDHGLVWVDVNGRMRVDKNGKPLTISFEDANNWHETHVPFHTDLNYRLADSLIGKSPSEEDGDVDSPSKAAQSDLRKLEDIDHEAPMSEEYRNAVKDIMTPNIPAFKQIDFGEIDHREGNVYQSSARGIRNNNPGNIKKTAQKWEGEIDGDDPVFKTFKTPEQGIKHASNLLKKYADRGINTIRGLVNRWSDTDQGEYMRHIAQKLGVGVNDVIDLKDSEVRAKIMAAIFEFENGQNPYSDDLIRSVV